MSRRTQAITTYISAGALIGFVLWFGVQTYAQGQLDELSEFLTDRREGAGQTQPDRGAECLYDVRDNGLVVTRKAHGQTSTESHTLTDTLVEPFFGGQQALIETRTTADTYNCINGEFASRALKADEGNPIGRVLFSSTGRTLAITLRRDNRERAVEVYTFKANPGASLWNDKFGPEAGGGGIEGEVLKARLVGESLVVVLEVPTGIAVHTYNFRAGHKNTPWNEFESMQRPFGLAGELIGGVSMPNRGKQAVITVRQAGSTQRYQFDFTCTQKPTKSSDKPCIWQALGE